LQSRSRGPRALFYAILVAVPAAVILLGIELLLPLVAPMPALTYHFWGNRPATLLPGVRHRAIGRHYDVALRTNSLGFNDLEHARERTAGTLRVLLLGDSFVEGLQVPPERHLARRLEALAAADGRRLEVIAMGASGQGQGHELANYEALGRSFAPDVVFLFFCVNDPWNNLFAAPAQGGRPPYVVDAAGALVSTLAGRPERLPSEAELRRHAAKLDAGGLRTLRYLGKRLAAILGTGEDEERAARLAALYELPPGQKDAVREDEQVMFDLLVAKLQDEIVVRDGRRLFGVIVSGNVRKRQGSAYLGLVAWAKQSFAREGIETLDLDTRFRERSRAENAMPSADDDPHWNEMGHAWVAEALYEKLEPLLGP
jgi:lysophospholipase L1-like esterase